MARQAGVLTENSFVKGLITETTELNFPDKACTDMDNTIVEDTGRIYRRSGFDLEQSFTTVGTPIEPDEAIVQYRWESAAGSGDINLLVVQKGSNLYFYDISNPSESVSPNYTNNAVDLKQYEVTTGSQDCEKYPCQFAISRGDLVVVNQACDPFFVRYLPDTDEVVTEKISITIRDLRGLPDGLGVTERGPYTDLATMRTQNPEHYYNLFNQGWFLTDALTQWDTARTDMPSNADYFYLYRTSATDAFDNNLVAAQSPGNRPAPKGHVIFSAFNPDRNAALAEENLSTVTFNPQNTSVISGGTVIGNFVTNVANMRDGNFNQPAAQCGQTASANANLGRWYGLTLGSGSRISKVRFSGPNNSGYQQTSGSGNNTVYTARLYGKTGAAPSSLTDGTILGTITFNGNRADPNPTIRTVRNTASPATSYDHVWLYLNYGRSENAIYRVAEVEFSSPSTVPLVTEATNLRPTAVASYAGRVFYGGIPQNRFNNEIYFSQIIETDDQYGKCYQKNDPASETISDLLADDGGIVKIPEMGQLIKIHRLYNTLLLFASNGVWTLTGPAGDIFRANEYSVAKISNVGTRSPYSFVDIKGVPIWWAEDGIYTVQYNPDYGSAQVISLSENSIRSYLIEIPQENRRYVKGAYDSANDRVVWAYHTHELNTTNKFHYDKFLCFNTQTQAFFPLSTSSSATPKILGVASITYSEEQSNQIKFLTKIPSYDEDGTVIPDSEDITFSISKDGSLYDWVDYAAYSEDPDDIKDYFSYFIVGYKIMAQGIQKYQTNYATIFSEAIEDSSCKVQSLFAFHSSPNSGRWSTQQEACRPNVGYRQVNQRRVKLRGNGNAVQLRFSSLSGKPFSIIGWAIWTSGNASP